MKKFSENYLICLSCNFIRILEVWLKNVFQTIHKEHKTKTLISPHGTPFEVSIKTGDNLRSQTM